MAKKIKLVIVDMQNDFVEGGALAVKGGKEVAEKIKRYMIENAENISRIYFTTDAHPINHCSFKENGGIWPAHCVIGTDGQNLCDEIIEGLKAAIDKNPKMKFLATIKGFNPDKEEYGAFEGKDSVIGMRGYDDVHVCGIAGDYCVLETARNLIKMGYKVHFLTDLIASIDGGKKLSEFIETNNIH